MGFSFQRNEAGPVMEGSERVELDLRGLKCPLPVLRTRKALRALAPGAVLSVLCTDPLAAIDIPHLVRTEGDALLAQDRSQDSLPEDALPEDTLRFIIRRGGLPPQGFGG